LKPNQQVIGARHIVKTFGKGEAAFTALNDVSVEIGAGESVAIVGKSGSGKSTLMHILALLDKPSTGTVLVGNKDTSGLKGRQIYELRNQHFGFIFQQFFLNERDSVLGNVTLPLVIAGVGRKEREERGLAALRAVELSDKAHIKASNLSGGQKQRVCVARALISRPSVIFADEPTGNLDSHTGKTVEDLMFRLNHKERITLIIVTHDPDIAARCTRQIHIKDGHLTHGGAV
jgi:putative ABC transport system ATP-binding protein